MKAPVKVISVHRISSSILRIILEKPLNFSFVPGHSIMISLAADPAMKRAMTFTSTNLYPYLEFYIKLIPSPFHAKLLSLTPRDTIVLEEMFGTIRYTVPGLFVAGGVGIAPVLSILRTLKENHSSDVNRLIYSAQYKEDLIAESELRTLLGNNLIITLTKEDLSEYEYGRIKSEHLKHTPDEKVYITGSDEFRSSISKLLSQ